MRPPYTMMAAHPMMQAPLQYIYQSGPGSPGARRTRQNLRASSHCQGLQRRHAVWHVCSMWTLWVALTTSYGPCHVRTPAPDQACCVISPCVLGLELSHLSATSGMTTFVKDSPTAAAQADRGPTCTRC